MHLEAAVKIGRFCGLRTVEDCIYNMEIHSMNFWKYTDIPKNLKQIHDEYVLWKDGKYELDLEAIDKENDEEMQKFFEREEADLAKHIKENGNCKQIVEDLDLFETE